MKSKGKLWRMIVPVIALTVLMGVADASAQCAPKVDNFYIFIDQSGSMFQRYIKLNMVKIVAAKKLVEQMDTLIPDLGYKGGIDLFADFQEVLPLFPYKPGLLTPYLAGIRDDKKIYGRQTPMKRGILELAEKAVLDQVVGPVTVIMLTDGMASPGQDPLATVKQLVDKYPRVAFHVISFAQPGVKDPRLIKDKKADLAAETKGQETNQQLAKLGHGQFVEAATVFNDRAALQSFVNNVFCAKEKIILRGIQFDFDKYNIKPEYEPILDEAVDQLKRWIYPYKLVITGHTDDQGTADYNQKLSERRAGSVMEYIAKKGIPAANMKAVGQGFNVPIASNKTEEGRAINRRVELDLLQ